MATYHCRVAATELATTVLRYLDALGAVAADHSVVVGDEIQLTLTDDEIAALEAHDLVVERREQLLTRAERSDTGSADGGGVDLLAGFVTGYLDGVEIASRVTAIAAAFPARCTVLTLPFPTAGYDGSLAAATGPATVLGLRITSNCVFR